MKEVMNKMKLQIMHQMHQQPAPATYQHILLLTVIVAVAMSGGYDSGDGGSYSGSSTDDYGGGEKHGGFIDGTNR